MTDGIHKSPNGTWGFTYKRLSGKDYKTKEACAKAYVTAIMQAEPKYKALVKDKSWDQVFRIVGVKV